MWQTGSRQGEACRLLGIRYMQVRRISSRISGGSSGNKQSDEVPLLGTLGTCLAYSRPKVSPRPANTTSIRGSPWPRIAPYSYLVTTLDPSTRGDHSPFFTNQAMAKFKARRTIAGNAHRYAFLLLLGRLALKQRLERRGIEHSNYETVCRSRHTNGPGCAFHI